MPQVYKPQPLLPPLVRDKLPKRPLVLRPNVDATYIRDDEGAVLVNPVKRFLRPYTLVTEPQAIVLPATGVNPEPSQPFVMPIDNQGPLEIYYSMFTSTGPFTIELFDADGRRKLMNREIHAASAAGTAEAPFIWSDPWVLHPEDDGRDVIVRFRNMIDQENTIRFALHGRRLFHYESPKEVQQAWHKYIEIRKLTEPYFLTTETNLTSQTGAPERLVGFIRNPDDSDFEWWKLSNSVVNLDGNPKEDWEFTLIEQGNQRPFMNAPILDTLALGNSALTPFPTGVLPFNLSEPNFFERNYKLQVVVQELANDAQNYFITLFGRKLHHES